MNAAEQSVQQAQGKLLQAKNDLQTAETAPEQISLSRANAQAADAHVLQRQAQFDASRAEPQLYGDPFARHGNRRQEKRRSGPEREYRTGTRGSLCLSMTFG